MALRKVTVLQHMHCCDSYNALPLVSALALFADLNGGSTNCAYLGWLKNLDRIYCSVCTCITQMLQHQNPNCSAESGTCLIRARAHRAKAADYRNHHYQNHRHCRRFCMTEFREMFLNLRINWLSHIEELLPINTDRGKDSSDGKTRKEM